MDTVLAKILGQVADDNLRLFTADLSAVPDHGFHDGLPVLLGVPFV
jgi:hypothetical protein